MIDQAFYDIAEPMTVGEVAELTGASLQRASDAVISTVADLDQDSAAGALLYVDLPRYLQQASDCKPAAAVLSPKATEELTDSLFAESAVLVHDNPKAAFAQVAAHLFSSLFDKTPMQLLDKSDYSEGFSTAAMIDKRADIAADVLIGPGSVIGPGVSIGAGTRIAANVVISHARIGTGCEILSGVIIGEAGFGFIPTGGEPITVPQLGSVVIGDNVTIGALCTIDRGGLKKTKIGGGTKLDDHVHIAHNVVLGKNCLIASQVGIAGSTTIGDGVMMGGQVGIADNLTIGDNAILSAKCGVMKNVPAGEQWAGYPARPARVWLKETATFSKMMRERQK
jgi:UDP-3-O-[3-hydroxymyristoyl] glucosamine N-acyltransferase